MNAETLKIKMFVTKVSRDKEKVSDGFWRHLL